jgi:hypothetical protein
VREICKPHAWYKNTAYRRSNTCQLHIAPNRRNVRVPKSPFATLWLSVYNNKHLNSGQGESRPNSGSNLERGQPLRSQASKIEFSHLKLHGQDLRDLVRLISLLLVFAYFACTSLYCVAKPLTASLRPRGLQILGRLGAGDGRASRSLVLIRVKVKMDVRASSCDGEACRNRVAGDIPLPICEDRCM